LGRVEGDGCLINGLLQMPQWLSCMGNEFEEQAGVLTCILAGASMCLGVTAPCIKGPRRNYLGRAGD